MILQEPFAIPSPANRVYKRTLTIDHLQVPSTQSDFPILVNFTDATFKTVANGGRVKATNAFTFSSDSAGASLLKWEVDRYDATTGEIVAWVKIASVSSSSDTVFYIRYGGTITTDQSDAANVWTNNFRAVWHLKDGSTLTLTDSVGGFTLTNNNSVAASAGQIDGAAAFLAGSSRSLTNASIGIGTAVTFTAWAKATASPQQFQGIMAMRGATGYCLMDFNSAGAGGAISYFVKATTDRSVLGSGNANTNIWYHVAMTYDSSAGLKTYLNAASQGTVAANGNINTDPTTINIGNDPGLTGFLTGNVDEPRVANVARSADWITVEYANQKTSQTLVALGSET